MYLYFVLYVQAPCRTYQVQNNGRRANRRVIFDPCRSDPPPDWIDHAQPIQDCAVTAADTTYRGIHAGVTKSGVKHYINQVHKPVGSRL